MRKLILISIYLLAGLQLINAQNSGISVEIHYPITFADQYQGDLSGVLGGSFQFQFSDNEKFNYGVEYKFDTNQATLIHENSTAKKKVYLYNHINLFSKINLDTAERLKMYLSTGISIFKYNNSKRSPSYIGFNVGTGFSYNITNQLYLFTNYTFIKARKKQQNNSEYIDRETLQIIRLGVGFNI